MPHRPPGDLFRLQRNRARGYAPLQSKHRRTAIQRKNAEPAFAALGVLFCTASEKLRRAYPAVASAAAWAAIAIS